MSEEIKNIEIEDNDPATNFLEDRIKKGKVDLQDIGTILVSLTKETNKQSKTLEKHGESISKIPEMEKEVSTLTKAHNFRKSLWKAGYVIVSIFGIGILGIMYQTGDNIGKGLYYAASLTPDKVDAQASDAVTKVTKERFDYVEGKFAKEDDKITDINRKIDLIPYQVKDAVSTELERQKNEGISQKYSK